MKKTIIFFYLIINFSCSQGQQNNNLLLPKELSHDFEFLVKALDEMNPELSALSGKALYYAKKSMNPEFSHVDRGNDQLLNRIIWYAMRGKESYPKAFSDGEEDDDDDDD